MLSFFNHIALPVEDDRRQWIDTSFDWLIQQFGKSELESVEVILPNDRFFPDKFQPNQAGLEALTDRVCDYMRVDRSRVQVGIIPSDLKDLREALPSWSGGEIGPAGLYFGDSDPSAVRQIGIAESIMREPYKLIGTIAHELAHVHLLGDNRVSRDQEDHEPLTDLTTVFWGLGVFSANSAFTFKQWQGDGKHGWSSSRMGYLSEQMFGYALAKFAFLRAEKNPKWSNFLNTNVKIDFRKSLKWLERNAAKP